MPFQPYDLRTVMRRPFCDNNLVAPMAVTNVTPDSATLAIIAVDARNPTLSATLKLICGQYTVVATPASEEEVRARIDRVFGDYCQFCGEPTEPGLRRCAGCRAIAPPPRSITVDFDASPARFVGKMCPYCQSQIEAEARMQVCSACGMPHHARCWTFNGGCTTFGCNGSPGDTGRYGDRLLISPDRPEVWQPYIQPHDGSLRQEILMLVTVILAVVLFGIGMTLYEANGTASQDGRNGQSSTSYDGTRH